MVSVFRGQCLFQEQQVREPQAPYSGIDPRRPNGQGDLSQGGGDEEHQTCLAEWMALMRLNQQPVPATRSANITERVTVPSSEHVAEIVGRQGTKIKQLRDRTGTYIKTPVRGEDPVFIVTGRPDDVLAARKDILSAADHFTQIRASRSRGTHNYGGMPLSYGGLAAPSQKQQEDDVTIEVKVPYRVVGLVVGPKGSTIKRIQATTSTYIVTPSRDREPCFEVTGTPQNVQQAKMEIETYIAMRTRNSDEEGPNGQRRSPNGQRRSPNGQRRSPTGQRRSPPGQRGSISNHRGSDGIQGRLSSNSSGLVSPFQHDSESPFGPPSVLASAVDQLSTHWPNSLGFSHFGVSGAGAQEQIDQHQRHLQQERMVQERRRRYWQQLEQGRAASGGAASVTSSHSQSPYVHQQNQVPERPMGLSVSDPTDVLRHRNESLIPDSRETSSASAFYGASIYGAVGSPTTSPGSSSNTYSISLSTPSGSNCSAFETPDLNSSEEKGSPPRKSCYMCYVEDGKEAALVPCGHLFCHTCAVQIFGGEGSSCPVNGCGAAVEKVLRIRQE